MLVAAVGLVVGVTGGDAVALLSLAATCAEAASPLPRARVLAKRAVALDNKLTHGESESDIANAKIPKLARTSIEQKPLRAHT